VVMQALSLVLPRHLPLAKQCAHLNGHRGLQGAVRQVLQALPQAQFVLKTDVQAYYASIDHHLLLQRLAAHITDPQVLHLIAQFVQRCAERGGLYWEPTQGIPLGSPLSPLMGAFFLSELDAALAPLGLFYVRYMDDILVLAPTRWTLRTAVRVVNQILASLRLAKHPDKTFIGRVEKGFDFLGYHFRPGQLTVAAKTLEHFVARVCRLDEQEPGEVSASSRLGDYVRRWVRWVTAGLAAGTPAVTCPSGLGNRSRALPPRWPRAVPSPPLLLKAI
jgi:RNA-directed DNA polymerase